MCDVCLQTGDAFAAAADTYVRRFLQKGIPSLYTDLKSLYSNPAKAEVRSPLSSLLCCQTCIVKLLMIV
jgi:NMDA receptor-regulated protein 1